MVRVNIDPSSRLGRWFRPGLALGILILGIAFAYLEARSVDREPFAIAALLAAAAVAVLALLFSRPRGSP
jgi:hypothetical protein